MKKTNKGIILIFMFVLLILFVAGIIGNAVSLITPPDREKMEKYFQRDKDNLIIIADYLNDLSYEFVSIEKADIKKGVMFTGANTRYQKIDDKTVLDALSTVLLDKKYILIGKGDNTVFFQKWRFLEKDRGIAFVLTKGDTPLVEFLTKYEMLSEFDWYYYEADYEEYRVIHGAVSVKPGTQGTVLLLNRQHIEPSPVSHKINRGEFWCCKKTL